MSFLRPLGNACHAWHSQYSPGIWLLHAFSLSVFKAKFPKFQVKHRIESCHWTVYSMYPVLCCSFCLSICYLLYLLYLYRYCGICACGCFETLHNNIWKDENNFLFQRSDEEINENLLWKMNMINPCQIDHGILNFDSLI